MKTKDLLLELFNVAKQRIRLKLLGLFISLVIAATFVIGVIEGSIKVAFFALFILFLLFVFIGYTDYLWKELKREIKRRDDVK